MQTVESSIEMKPPNVRDRILLAGERIVIERGIRDSSVKDILESAGVCRRTFYLHFKSKEDVFEALYRSKGTDRLFDAMQEAIQASSDATGKVLAGVDAFLRFEQSGGPLLALLQSEALHSESALHPARLEIIAQLVGLVGETVEENLGVSFDPDVFRTFFLGVEGLLIEQLRLGPLSDSNLKRLQGMMRAILVGMFMNAPHLPLASPR